MSTFSESIEITAATHHVWAAVSDIGSIADWNPGVVQSRLTSRGEVGLGSTRVCELGGKNYLDEEVVEFVYLKRIAFRINATNLPFASAIIRFTLTPAGSHTLLAVAPDYTLKFGLIGRLMDQLLVRRVYRKGMQDLLHGLKPHLESALSAPHETAVN